jgi:hypothetical protein
MCYRHKGNRLQSEVWEQLATVARYMMFYPGLEDAYSCESNRLPVLFKRSVDMILGQCQVRFILSVKEKPMIRKSVVTLFLMLGTVLAVYAADLNGRWEGKMANPNGDDIAISFTFKVDGEKLTGSVEGPAGELPLEEGKVKGDEISFVVKFGDNTINHQGKVSGDSINLKVQGPWGDSEMTLKRIADK